MDGELEIQRRLRNHGVTWICFGPVFVVMAVISTVSSEKTYYVQLVASSLIAASGLVCGIGAVRSRPWAARGLRLLTWIVAAYFTGAALLVLAWVFFVK